MTDKHTWGYKMEGGEVVPQLFHDGLPKGWEDSPDKCKPKRAKKKAADE